MKKATAELNLSLFVIISIGILSAFFYTIVWPMLQSNMNRTAKCADSVCDKGTLDENGMVTCSYYVNGKEKDNGYQCPYKG